MVTRIGGMSSGLDTEAIISSLIESYSLPQTQIKDQITEDEDKLTAWDSLDTKITTLRLAASELSSYTTWRQMSATPVDSTVMTATAGISATAGTYAITVSTLARAHRFTSDAQSSTTTALGLTGDFDIEGETVSVISTDTLEGIRDKINTASLNITDATKAVKASIIGKSLVIERSQTGAGSISITDGTNNILQSGAGGLGIMTGTVASPTATLKNVIQTGADLSATINGVAITATSNSGVTDAVQGLTLNFLKEDSTTLTVSHDTASIKSLITDYLAAYNDAMDLAQVQGSVNLSSSGTVTEYGSLQGNYLISSIQIKARSIMTTRDTDPNNMDQSYNSLYTVGIWSTGQENQFEITDEDKLDDALANHFDEVEDLFRNYNSGIFRQMNDYLYSLQDPVEGSLTTTIQTIEDNISSNTTKVSNMQSDIDDYEAMLWEHFTTMEDNVSSLKSQGSYLMSALGLT